MSFLNVSIRQDGKKVRNKLKVLTNGLHDFKEPLKRTGEDLVKLYGDDNFDKQGQLIGKPWRKLSSTTLLARSQRRGHYKNDPISTDKILVWTGKLKSGFRKKVSRIKLVIDNTVEYFEFNQKKRPMLGVNRNVLAIISKNFTKYIRKLLK